MAKYIGQSHLPFSMTLSRTRYLLLRRLPALRPSFLSPLTQRMWYSLGLPAWRSLHHSNLCILPRISKEVDPMLHPRSKQTPNHIQLWSSTYLESLIDLLLRLLPLLRLQISQLLRRVKIIYLRIIKRDEHLLHAPHIRSAVFFEAIRDKASGGIGTCEEMVGAAWAVVSGASGHIVDRAVDC